MGKKRAERLQVMLQADEVRAVEEWRFENHMPSRSAAARALMNLGLNHSRELAGSKRLLDANVSSGEIGVVNAGPTVEAMLGEQQGAAVLVAEENLLLAHGLKGLLQDAGFSIHSFLTTPSAMRVALDTELTGGLPSAAVVGASLDAATRGAFVAALRQQRLPVVLFCVDDDDSPTSGESLPVVTPRTAPAMLARLVANPSQMP